MKQLLALQTVLFFSNGLRKDPFNWWLICSPLLLYAAYEVGMHIREEIRLKKAHKRKQRALPVNRGYRIKEIQKELDKNLN